MVNRSTALKTNYTLGDSKTSFDCLYWDNFKRKYFSPEKDFYFIFKKNVMKRKPIYLFSFNFLNYLLKKEKKNFYKFVAA